MHHHDPQKNPISVYAWAVIIASVVLSVVLLIVGLHSYCTKRAARIKRLKAAEEDKLFGGVIGHPLPVPPKPPGPTRPNRGRSLVQSEQ